MSEIERGETEKKGAKMNPDMEAALRDAYAHAEVLSRGGQEKEDTQEEGADVTQKAQEEESASQESAEGAGSAQEDDSALISELQDKLVAALASAEDAKANALRHRADLENARRRFEREQREGRKFAAEKVLKSLLPIVDDFDRALEHSGAEEGALLEGVKLVHRKFLQTLEAEGAASFFPIGEAFDPTSHEAMTQMPSADVPPGHVAQVFQRGWRLQDRLLRPAKVIVATAPAPAPEEG